MKRISSLVCLLIVPAFILITAYHTGSPGGKTNSPGDGFNNCTECHIGTPTAVSDWIVADIPIQGYEPGITYEISVTGNHEAPGRFGFELTAEDQSGTKTGTLTPLDNETQLANNNHSITHTDQGITPNGDFKTWVFEWTAPDPGVGNITFYASLNAANGDGTNSGDIIYTTFKTYPEGSTVIPDLSVKELALYPNPAADILHIDINPKFINGTFSIIDISGRLVFERKLIMLSNQISVSEFKNGLYFAIIKKDELEKTIKLIVD